MRNLLLQLSITSLLLISNTLVHAKEEPLPRRAVFGLGFSPVPADQAKLHKLEEGVGILATDVVPEKSAASAGIEKGDIVIAMNNKPLKFSETPARVRELESGKSFNVTAIRQGEKIELNGTVSEKPRDPGNSHYEVLYRHITSHGKRMRTIITRPRKEGKYPGFMFIQGFSPVSYDFTLEGSRGDVTTINGPLLYEFANSNFITIRVEKPGVGDSEGGPFADLDFTTELDIYRQALKQLKDMPEVDAKNIFIFGHSMGGAFGPMIAAESPVRGIAVYGAASRTWHEYLLDTLRYQGLVAGDNYENTDERVRAGSRLIALVFLENKSIDEIKKSHPELNPLTDALFPNGMFSGKSLEFWRQLGQENMPSYWSRCGAHVLAVRGASDYVTYDVDHKLIADIVNREKPGTARSLTLPESDHLFHKHATEPESLQAMQKGEYNTAFAKLMKTWIEEVMAQ